MPKVVLIVLIVLVVAFVAIIGVGAIRNDGDFDVSTGWVENFEFGGAPSVEVASVSSRCLETGSVPTFRVHGKCVARITSDDTRLLRLEAPQATWSRTGISYDPDDSDAVEVNENPIDSKDGEFAIPVAPGGGDLVLTCNLNQTCLIRIVE